MKVKWNEQTFRGIKLWFNVGLTVRISRHPVDGKLWRRMVISWSAGSTRARVGVGDLSEAKLGICLFGDL